MFLLSLSAWVNPSVSWLYLPCVCVICTCCHFRHEWTHLWVGCICLVCALYALVVTLGMSGPICEWAVSVSCVRYMHLLSLSAWVDTSVNWMYLPRICFVCSCHHSRHEWTNLWVGCICLLCALYALVVTLGTSGPICEWAVSALHLHYMHLLSLSAWVDPSVSGLYLPRVCIICFCCPSRHEWTHLWVGCICLAFALYALVVTLGMSGPICELAVSSLLLHYMHFLSPSAWVDPSVSGLYLPRICFVCTCCHSRHEWTYLWVGCICLVCALFVLVGPLSMSGPCVSWMYLPCICFVCSCHHSRHEWTHLWVGCIYLPRVCVICFCCPSRHEWTHLWVGCICLVCVLYVLVVTLGMSGPICEWAASALCVRCLFLLALSAWVGHVWVGCICLAFALYALVITLGMSGPICELAVYICLAFALYAFVVPLSMSGPICEWAVSVSCVHYMHLLSISAWVDPSVSGLYRPLVCVICSCCYSRHEWTHLWIGCICLAFALYALVITLGMSGPICEWAVSASRLHYMLLLSLSAWVDPSVSWLYLPHVCIICTFCHSRHEWTHLWVGCIFLAFALYALFVPLGMSGPICEWAVSASYLLCMHLLSLSAWVNPSVSWLHLPLVCVICSCCHSWHEWTHLWIGCICIAFALYALFVPLGMSGLICEWAVSALRLHYMHLLSLLAWVGHVWVGCICLVCVLYVLVVTLGMREPICEWAASASHLLCMLLSSLSAWVDPSASGLYLPCVCVICCCPYRHEWTHLWVGCICLVCVLYAFVVPLGMSGPICEWAVSVSCVRYMFLLSLSAWVDPSVNWMYLPRICFVCSCHHSRHEWTHLWVGCICLAFALYAFVVTLGMSGPICEWAVSASCVHYMFLLLLSAWVDQSVSGLYLPLVCIICTCCHSRHEWTHLWVGCICLVCRLYVLVVTLGMSGPICELDVSASHLLCMLLSSLSAWVNPSVSGLYLPRVCIICSCCLSRHK